LEKQLNNNFQYKIRFTLQQNFKPLKSSLFKGFIYKLISYNFKTHSPILILSCFLFILYGLISFVNHYNFCTYAFDLGMYNNAIYDYAHFRFNYSESMQAAPVNLLSADHFDLFLMLVSPIYWLFGTYTLLVIQAVVLVMGGIGIYCIVKRTSDDIKFATIMASMFWCFYGVFNALAYDYHGNVIAAGLLPWFVYFLLTNQYAKTIILFFLIIINKESMALWMFFVGTGFAWINRNNFLKRNTLLLLSCFSLLYFILLINYVMPALGGMERYAHTDYKSFGSSSNEIVKNILSHPFTSIKYLFIEHIAEAKTQFSKIEFHIFILLSGGILLLFRPVYLWMMIPVYITKLFHDRWEVHGIGGQYSIEFAPILVLCSWDFIQKKWPTNKSTQRKIAIALLVLTVAVAIRNFDHTTFYTNKRNIRIYKKEHYTSDFNRASVDEAFRLIPDDAIISVQSQFHPHLAYRNKAYQFPLNNHDAEYFLFSNKSAFYPLSKFALDSLKITFENDSGLTELFNKDSIYLFKVKRSR